jgi:hypothetical protein
MGGREAAVLRSVISIQSASLSALAPAGGR